MSAPALIALAHGSRDPRSARTVREIVATTKQLRPDLKIEVAFLDHVKPDIHTVVDRLMGKGYTEVVVVPLLLTSAFHARVDVPQVVQQVAVTRPDIAIRVADVIGTDAALLTILDARLRESLKSARVRELDALVLAAAGSSDARANASVSRLARLWAAQHKLPTSVAFASAAPPSTGEAVRDWRRQGRRHVAVGSLFIAPGMLPDRAAELALEAGAVAVSAPLGAHGELGRLILARYSVGALQLVEIPA
ncbi:MAG: sirohydrochlorin chelatase [Nocardioidaceae bacterium]|nr:sirohydrochlorin chelatase [Nocardioidaceae bacterium]